MSTLVIIRFIAFSGLLYLLYILVFKRFSFFAGNRWLLLSIPLVSFVIPLIAPSFVNNVAPALSSYQLDAIILNNTPSQTAEITTSFDWLSITYFSGAGVILFLLLLGLIKAIHIKKTAEQRTENIYYSSAISSAYTFFKSIIIPLSLKEHKDIDTIIKHEQVHVRQWHGLDNLYYQIITALTWFNPFIHLLAKELRQTHECLADEEAIEKTSREEYAHLLLSSAFGNELNFPLAAGTATPFFNSSLIKTRIAMIYKSKTNKHFQWAYLTILPLLTAMILYSCQKNDPMNSASQTSEQTSSTSLEADHPPLLEGCSISEDQSEQMACFTEKLNQYALENLKIPESFKNGNIVAFDSLRVEFTIGAEGKVTHVETKGEVLMPSGISDEKFNAVVEARKELGNVLYTLPIKSGAVKDGKAVAMKFTLPIDFFKIR